MVVPLRKWLRRLIFLAVFVAAAWVLYRFLGAASAWIEPNKYREPGGRAVKAFREGESAPENGGRAPAGAPGSAPNAGADEDSPLERLRLFYWYGE